MPDYHTDATTTLPEMTGWLASDIKVNPEHIVSWVVGIMTKNPNDPDSPYGFAVVRLFKNDDLAGNSLLASAIINATLEHMNDGQE